MSKNRWATAFDLDINSIETKDEPNNSIVGDTVRKVGQHQTVTSVTERSDEDKTNDVKLS